MKPNIFVTYLFSAVIFHAAVISERIFHGNNKDTSKSFSRLSTSGLTNGNLKTNENISSKRTSKKLPVAGSLLRPESLPKTVQCNDLGKTKGKRYGCCICHGCQPCVGGCMPHCECDCCRHECDEGCWCPIPGAEEAAAPKKKPEEPCCCPCCCPCCPVPCCQQCCHHVHHHHHHCCPCCHCCHCCHCCPCCCHCCHCKRSQGPLSSSFFRRPLYLYLITPFPYFSGLYNDNVWSLLRDGPLSVH